MKQELIEVEGSGYWTYVSELRKLIEKGYIIDATSYIHNGIGVIIVHKSE